MRTCRSQLTAVFFAVTTAALIGCGAPTTETMSCSLPTENCSGACVDTSSSTRNCGACGHACAAGEQCSGGTCVPSCGTKTLCDGACVDTSSDDLNCGRCGHVCGSNQSCSGGTCASTCACTTGKFSCSGSTTLNTCNDGCSWTANDCNSSCIAGGYDGASGCGYASDLGHDACLCYHGGISDACTSDSTCLGSSFCASLAHWCQASSDCASNADCLGTGPGGRNNTNGYFNYCVNVTGGAHQCFPGCSSDADCAAYAFGACKAVGTINGTTQYACTSP
jgi:hypothetical protein